MKVAIVAGIVVQSDAISAAVASQAALAGELDIVDDVVVFAQHIDRSLPCRSHVVGSSWELVRHPDFRDCDVAIFHWGIHYGLFDALLLLAGTTPTPVCHFHNCTPADLVADHDRDLIGRSLAQAQLLADRDIPVWTFSTFNERTLEHWGVRPARISFVPFPIQAPRPLVSRRRTGHVDIAVVGRLVPAKGVHVILEAIALLPTDLRDRLTVRIAGNTGFSHDPYIDELTSIVGRHDLAGCVEFVGQLDDDGLWSLFERSHVVVSASFHEGLCVPVVEAYLAGARVIGNTASNLPYVVVAPDPTVAPGDPLALAAAIEQVAGEVLGATMLDRRAQLQMAGRYGADASRSALRRALAEMQAAPAPGRD